MDANALPRAELLSSLIDRALPEADSEVGSGPKLVVLKDLRGSHAP